MHQVPSEKRSTLKGKNSFLLVLIPFLKEIKTILTELPPSTVSPLIPRVTVTTAFAGLGFATDTSIRLVFLHYV